MTFWTTHFWVPNNLLLGSIKERKCRHDIIIKIEKFMNKSK